MLINPVERYMKNEGKKEGKKEGIKEGKIEFAKKMIEEGFSIDYVMEISKLTEDEILN